jgi:hypothetical protein
MNPKLKTAIGVSALLVSAQAVAQITFYEGEGYRGRSFTTDTRVWNMDRSGFNDRASSVIVERGRWEVCEDARFEGRCVILRRGNYDSLRGMGLDNRISSVRPVERSSQATYEPEPVRGADVRISSPSAGAHIRSADHVGPCSSGAARAALLGRAAAGRRAASRSGWRARRCSDRRDHRSPDRRP